jgi:hypothetical protein
MMPVNAYMSGKYGVYPGPGSRPTRIHRDALLYLVAYRGGPVHTTRVIIKVACNRLETNDKFLYPISKHDSVLAYICTYVTV